MCTLDRRATHTFQSPFAASVSRAMANPEMLVSSPHNTYVMKSALQDEKLDE
jgi:hypothetical protein